MEHSGKLVSTMVLRWEKTSGDMTADDAWEPEQMTLCQLWVPDNAQVATGETPGAQWLPIQVMGCRSTKPR